MGDGFVVYSHDDSYDGGNTEYTDLAPCKVKLKVGRHVTEISFPHAISPLSMQKLSSATCKEIKSDCFEFSLHDGDGPEECGKDEDHVHGAEH